MRRQVPCRLHLDRHLRPRHRPLADHGTVARTVDADVAEAKRIWEQLAVVGVDMDDVADQLEREGVTSFQKAFDELIDALSAKAAELGS